MPLTVPEHHDTTDVDEQIQTLHKVDRLMTELLSQPMDGAVPSVMLDQLTSALATVETSEKWLKCHSIAKSHSRSHLPSAGTTNVRQLQSVIETCLSRSEELIARLSKARDRLVPRQNETAQRQAMCKAYQQTIKLS